MREKLPNRGVRMIEMRKRSIKSMAACCSGDVGLEVSSSMGTGEREESQSG